MMLWASIRYEDRSKIEKMDQETWSAFCDVWPLMDSSEAKKLEGESRVYKLGYDPKRFSYEEAVYLEMQFGVRLEVVQWQDSGLMLTKMGTGKFGAFEGRYHTPTASDVMAGRAVQIAIPDLGLLQIRQVTYMEDACTDEVGSMLKKGWRILAICPPNAQRRPDYIFGRADVVDED